MRRVAIIALLTLQCAMMAQVGTWHNYLSYYEPQQIVKAGNVLFVRASNDLYQYNLTDHSITTYDKLTGLSDNYITHIAWNQEAKRLIIVYQNSNIDLMDTSGNITNISSLYRKATTEDKTIDSLTVDGQYIYLYARLGIVKVDMKRAEIKETYTKNHPDYPTSLPPYVNNDWAQYIDVVKTLKPGGPKYNYFGYMKFLNNRLYTCNGDYEHSTAIQILGDNEWTIYQDEGISETTGVSFQGAYCLDVDPSNSNHIFAGSRNGLYEYLDGNFVNYYDNSNSPIECFNGTNKEYQIVTGTQFDKDGNFWFLNSSAPTTALVKFANGTFTKLSHSELMKLNTDAKFPNRSNANLCNMMIDSQGLMWFVNDNWVLPAFYQYHAANDELKAYETFTNQDGVKIDIKDGVRCVVEDLNKNLWIGTSVGPLLLERNSINDTSPIFTQVKVPRNDGSNYADYLLSGVSITCMAIDAAGRKWFGTTGDGVYLISADNMTQLQHFNTENSKLLSNDIMSIAIDDTSGEVFIGTFKGLCSYISDATATNTEMTKDNVWAYPNPVTPDYTGLITVVGLTLNADVKIVSSNGKLIAEGRSNGGTFTWDGCDRNGNRVASGIYMVVTATSDGKKGTVCKIAVVK